MLAPRQCGCNVNINFKNPKKSFLKSRVLSHLIIVCVGLIFIMFLMLEFHWAFGSVGLQFSWNQENFKTLLLQIFFSVPSSKGTGITDVLGHLKLVHGAQLLYWFAVFFLCFIVLDSCYSYVFSSMVSNLQFIPFSVLFISGIVFFNLDFHLGLFYIICIST